ncbi:MAG: type 2 isopentenyl-diphosphate Delta-isomerase [Sporomusaceae bacterium]|nr:type 2 isopentenyl-diphosphate Delta-isomerase [Sporomusaceae bacterium]
MSRQSRKLDHIKYALALDDGPATTGFQDIQLIHNALPELAFHEVDLSVTFMGISLVHPVIINAITGGNDDVAAVNAALAALAAKTKSAMAVGSQFAAVAKGQGYHSYEVIRQQNPDGIVFANLGAHASWQEAQAAVDMIGANALQIHLNAAQEMIMPEGDRSFKGYLDNIATIASHLSVPVVVKEVGNGIAREQAEALCGAGIQAIDVGGAGGTNFVAIEASRKPQENRFSQDWLYWGIPTALSALEVKSALKNSVDLMISGGVRTPIEAAKALAIGAKAVGIAAPWLRFLSQQNEAEAIAYLDDFLLELKKFMLLCGADNPLQLAKRPFVITGFTREWLTARQIDITSYALR